MQDADTMIAVDMDGTLLGLDGKVSARNLCGFEGGGGGGGRGGGGDGAAALLCDAGSCADWGWARRMR